MEILLIFQKCIDKIKIIYIILLHFIIIIENIYFISNKKYSLWKEDYYINKYLALKDKPLHLMIP
jgi:hypothetical protein